MTVFLKLFRTGLEKGFDGHHSGTGVVPPDILRTTRRHLEAAGMPEALLKRLWDKRVLWFVRMQPTSIAKLHMADLATKYFGLYSSLLPCNLLIGQQSRFPDLNVAFHSRQVLLSWL